VRYSTITDSPVMVTPDGDPLSFTCHCDAPSATGELAVTQAQTCGHGLKVCVVARTTKTTMTRIAT
jgi:hypothetical protein